MHCETPCPPSRLPWAVPGPVPSLAPPASVPETYLIILSLREADQPLFLSGMKTAGGHLGLRTGETVRNAGKQDWWEPGTGRACVPSGRGPHVFMPRATDADHMLRGQSRPLPGPCGLSLLRFPAPARCPLLGRTLQVRCHTGAGGRHTLGHSGPRVGEAPPLACPQVGPFALRVAHALRSSYSAARVRLVCRSVPGPQSPGPEQTLGRCCLARARWQSNQWAELRAVETAPHSPPGGRWPPQEPSARGGRVGAAFVGSPALALHRPRGSRTGVEVQQSISKAPSNP